MKSLILSIFLYSSIFAVEIAPTNFDLRSLAILVSQECNKNIVISQDVKNLSADYLITTDMSPELLFLSFKRLIESKGLFLNDYNGFYVIDEKDYKVVINNYSNIELTMKILEINNDKYNEKGFASLANMNSSLNLSSTDFKHLTFDKLFSANFSGVLNALQTHDYVKIISEPQVIVANGRTTKMNVGDTISVKTSSYSDSTSLSGSSFRNTYVQKELGLTISVTPIIQQDGTISLKTSLIHEILKKQNDDGLISTSKKSIDSEFNLLDGGSISIGGLTSSQDVKDVSKIPVLGDIPILDYIFAHESVKTIRNSLSIFIQVKVIK